MENKCRFTCLYERDFECHANGFQADLLDCENCDLGYLCSECRNFCCDECLNG